MLMDCTSPTRTSGTMHGVRSQKRVFMRCCEEVLRPDGQLETRLGGKSIRADYSGFCRIDLEHVRV